MEVGGSGTLSARSGKQTQTRPTRAILFGLMSMAIMHSAWSGAQCRTSTPCIPALRELALNTRTDACICPSRHISTHHLTDPRSLPHPLVPPVTFKMPIAVPQIHQYSHVPETKENLDWAELPTVDLSSYGTSTEANAALAQTLIEAIRTKGFFYVTHFGVSQEAVDRQFALGQAFYALPVEEKLKYEPDLEAGDYNGYRPAGNRILSAGIRDKTEVWNMATNDGRITQALPELLQQHKQEIEGFAEVRSLYLTLVGHNADVQSLHDKVLDPLYHLIEIALELPERYLRDLHKWNVHDESHLRYMKYSKFSPEEQDKLRSEGDGL